MGYKIPLSSVISIIYGLKKLYIQKLRPLEITYKFNDFVSPLLTNIDFDAKPMFWASIPQEKLHLSNSTEVGYPGAHIGPEPTTDRFVVVMNGPDERSVPGNTISVQADMLSVVSHLLEPLFFRSLSVLICHTLSPVDVWVVESYTTAHSKILLREENDFDRNDLLVLVVGSLFSYKGLTLDRNVRMGVLEPLLVKYVGIDAEKGLHDEQQPLFDGLSTGSKQVVRFET